MCVCVCSRAYLDRLGPGAEMRLMLAGRQARVSVCVCSGLYCVPGDDVEACTGAPQ